ncbi:hypothetical protein TanjilG_02844 [Lupinus angustifolius]|uniref:Uncharacterized protein n=1 Tax=Lupinus angustifolius TaxID=3871 RepID=A0A4P1RL36_LUPAN|nr:hypothetical protein TanjilG_02844 [Lupinus angustifolius]
MQQRRCDVRCEKGRKTFLLTFGKHDGAQRSAGKVGVSGKPIDPLKIPFLVAWNLPVEPCGA